VKGRVTLPPSYAAVISIERDGKGRRAIPVMAHVLDKIKPRGRASEDEHPMTEVVAGMTEKKETRYDHT